MSGIQNGSLAKIDAVSGLVTWQGIAYVTFGPTVLNPGARIVGVGVDRITNDLLAAGHFSVNQLTIYTPTTDHNITCVLGDSQEVRQDIFVVRFI